jgi:hypothetical protein
MGRSRPSTLTPAASSAKWGFEAQFSGAGPVVADGTIHVVTENDALYALRP